MAGAGRCWMFPAGRQDPDSLLLPVLSANEDKVFLTCSDATLMWQPVPQKCIGDMRE